MSFDSHRISFYSSLCKDHSLSNDILEHLFSPKRWYSTKFIGIGSHAIVVHNKFASKEFAYKICMKVYSPDVEYEGLFGTWLYSCPGPFYPPRELDKEKSLRKFLNIIGVRRVARLDKTQAEKISEILDKMVSHWNQECIPTRDICQFIHDAKENIKDMKTAECSAFVMELEKFPMDSRKWMRTVKTEDDILFRAKSCLLQVLKTYEHLRDRFSWIHGDLRIDNILVKDSNYERLEYPGEKKTHILEAQFNDDCETRKTLQICAMADLGFSASDSKEFMNSMGFKSNAEWNTDFIHEIGYDMDLHLLGLTMGTAVANSYRKINGTDSEGKILTLLKFCAEMMLPMEFLLQGRKIDENKIDFEEKIGTTKSTVKTAQTAEMACDEFLKKTTKGRTEWYDILYIQKKAMIKDMKPTDRKFSEHIFFEEYEKKENKKRKRKRE